MVSFTIVNKNEVARVFKLFLGKIKNENFDFCCGDNIIQ